MPYQIALSCSPASEAELKAKGFEKREVYVKYFFAGANSDEAEKLGDRDFFAMKNPPSQFITTSWWGRDNGP